MIGLYVLQTLTGQEQAVRDRLIQSGCTALLPMEARLERSGGKWDTVPRVLMPGYVFVETELTPEDYHRITGTPGVICFLQRAAQLPLPDHEAALIRLWGGSGQLEPSALQYGDGQSIRVVSGPLKGREGSIIGFDKRRRRVRVRLTLHGKEVPVTLSAQFIVPQG